MAAAADVLHKWMATLPSQIVKTLDRAQTSCDAGLVHTAAEGRNTVVYGHSLASAAPDINIIARLLGRKEIDFNIGQGQADDNVATIPSQPNLIHLQH